MDKGYLALALVLALGIGIVLMFAGCRGKAKDPADSENKPGESSAGKGEHVVNGVDFMDTPDPVNLKDDWTAEKDLSRIRGEDLGTSVKDCRPVAISVEKLTQKDESWESYTGGGDVEYARVTASEDAPEVVREIFERQSEAFEKEAGYELEQAVRRWKVYHASEPKAFIALTPRIGIYVGRADTRVVSYVTETYRYNREYEPNAYFVYGHTYDAMTGRELTLKDFFEDTSQLPELICEAIRNTNITYPKAVDCLEEGFVQRIRECVEGCRNDGNFAWMVTPVGIEFHLTNVIKKTDTPEENTLLHTKETALVPFAVCKALLRKDAYLVEYDFMEQLQGGILASAYGADFPVPDGKKLTSFEYYAVHLSGKDYLYCCDDQKTLVFSVVNGRFQKIGETLGEVASISNDRFASRMDPEDFRIGLRTTLVRELSLYAKAKAGADGLPERTDWFYDEYNVEPIVVTEEFEAEVFKDREAAEGTVEKLPKYEYLVFLRTDGEHFIDMEIQEGKICRLYVEQTETGAWIVNGRPLREIISLKGWLEE